MKTLVINKKKLNLGGIENILYNLIKYAISQHYRVVWLANSKHDIFRGYKDILDHIEIITSDKKVIARSAQQRSLKFSEDEEVVILSYTPFAHDFALSIREQNPSINIKPLYVLANTKGSYYFIEEYFKWPLNRYVKKKMATIHQEWEERDEIRYYTQQQRKAIEDKYGITISDPKAKQVPHSATLLPINENDLQKRAERKEFNIISITRFVFPHKQYLLGLVDAYAQLKSKYNQLTLNIIGYGIGEKQLKEKIDALPENIKKDIHLLGPKTNGEIDEIMRNMHLNVSVAGSILCGARNCVVSLPARNYCEGECEVYGYLPSSIKLLSSTEKGSPVIPYIEELINMPTEEYIQECKKSYQAFASLKPRPEYIFEQEGNLTIGQPTHHLFFSIFSKLALFASTYWKIMRRIRKSNKQAE